MHVVDGHAHLEELQNPKEAIERAAAAGVAAIVAVGSDLDSNKRVLALCGRYRGTEVYPALGIHPWNLQAHRVEETLGFIESRMERCVAIGEIGLDYWLKEIRKDPSKAGAQKDVYRRLLLLAERYRKPAIIHARGSWEDCLALALDSLVRRAVFHWYSGPLDILKRILDAGYCISATPAAAYSRHHRLAIKETPLDRLLLETDAPVAYQGKSSEPIDVLRTLDTVAEIKGLAAEEVAAITTRNAIAFFGIPEPAKPATGGAVP